ncbi:hypothetical protein NPIL_552281 [Nephila pilipes]|uniref:Uncharacterized protein n=1 Tax=Nephila pilipes TaxID=299642 RepID=A0A8X6QM29_NEPPI|nr:hypothetical protein NPIL_552281 [Nephila pilipes]
MSYFYFYETYPYILLQLLTDLDISLNKQHSSVLPLKILPNPSVAHGFRPWKSKTTRKMKRNSKMTKDPSSLPYHPVQSTLALSVKENRRLNQISKSVQVYVKLLNVNSPKISPFTMTMNTWNIKASRIQSGYSIKN